jgi:hypothetical protein
MPHFTLDELLELAEHQDPPAGYVVGISGMQRNPPCFIDWMYYHLAVGISHFILRIEDPDAELQRIIDRLTAVMEHRFIMMEASTARSEGGFGDVMSRAENFVTTEAIPKARELGVNFLFWIDSDELFYPVNGPTVQDAFEDVYDYRDRGRNHVNAITGLHGGQILPCKDELACVSFQNWEAWFPNPECGDQPFTTEGTVFQTDTSYFSLYTEGKPACNVENLDVVAFTPHGFNGGDTALMPASTGVILHFDSPSFAAWQDKWSRHSSSQLDKGADKFCVGKFPYYHDSIDIVRKGGSKKQQLEVYKRYRVWPPKDPQQYQARADTMIEVDVLEKIEEGRQVLDPHNTCETCTLQ